MQQERSDNTAATQLRRTASSSNRASGLSDDGDGGGRHLGQSIRAQHASQELSEEERILVEQVQAGLMRRMEALDIKLVDCIARCTVGTRAAASQ